MNRTIEVNFGTGKKYSLTVPTVGQYMEIESKKMVLSSGQYNSMIYAGTKTSIFALDIIDMTAVLSVVGRDIMADLKVTSLQDADISDILPMLKVYRLEIAPWLSEWNELFRLAVDDAKEDKS